MSVRYPNAEERALAALQSVRRERMSLPPGTSIDGEPLAILDLHPDHSLSSLAEQVNKIVLEINRKEE